MIKEISKATEDQQLFYKSLFSNLKGYAEIRLIKNGLAKSLYLTLDELMNYVTPDDTNVYIGMYERGRYGSGKTQNCTKTNAIYLDFDGMELIEIEYRITTAQMPTPSMIINSGHGYHVYWLLDKPVGHELKPIVDKLAEELQADKAATDTARVLRVPDTFNVKAEPVRSRMIEYTGRRTSLQTFEQLLGVKAKVEIPERTGAVMELVEIKTNGLNNMATGVDKGQRNFCTGRIVQTLKRSGNTRYETTEIVMKWNALNRPVKDAKEVKREINNFWFENGSDNRLRYDGKEFSDERLQALNEQFIDDQTTFFIGDGSDTHNYDNELLHPSTFKETSGLTFAALSVIKLEEDKGIRMEHLADLCGKRNPKGRALRTAIQTLQDMKYIKVVKRKNINHYVFTEKGNYNRGYTAVSKSLHRSFLHEELQEHEYKLMILLESFAFDNKKEVYPSNQTLALRSGQTDRTIRRNLKQLEHKQFIKQEVKQSKRIIRFIYR